MSDLLRRLEARDFGGEHSLATIEACAVAIRHLVPICREHGVDGAVPAAFERLAQTAIGAGHAGDDFAALARFIRRAGPQPVESMPAAVPEPVLAWQE